MPTETAAGAAAWAKWGYIFAGALGVAVTIAWMQTMTRRQMVLAIASGMASSIWGTPVAIAVARGYLPPAVGQEVIDGLAGMIGFSLGMVGIYLAGGVLRMAEGFSANPWAVIDRLRGRTGGEQ